MSRLLLITPPFLQPNAPYPATAYLKGWLGRRGIDAAHADLSVELLNDIFSRDFLNTVFDRYGNGSNDDQRGGRDNEKDSDRGDIDGEKSGNIYGEEGDGGENIRRIYALRRRYAETVGPVMAFLRGEDPTLANRICTGDFLPQASRFDGIGDLNDDFGWLGQQDCAKHLCTLYLQDISDFIRATVTPHFEIVKYAERISASAPEFSSLEMEMIKPLNMIEQRMTGILRGMIEEHKPEYIGFTIPFPGNLLPSLRCGQYIRANYPGITIILGGGYPTTELRQMSDRGIFSYADYVILDDGETALEKIVTGGEPTGAYTESGFREGSERITHAERGCPDFGGLPHGKYFSLCEVANPMHRLWSDGRWNRMTIAHGCYWAKCAFCDTSLDYIKCYEAVSATQFVNWMERVAEQTGSGGFHFTDEAAPPKLLKEISLELLRRGLKYTWWTNIRFESAFTGDLCRLMAAAGCIAVSGGLEVASDRLLGMINKGITIEQATIAMRNFYYAGIMVHTYLMYGLPTQTLQESVDALEVVRQMFRAELIGSAFWHRYAMTVHSPSGMEPERFGVRRKGSVSSPFANNEVFFAENRGYNINVVGEALRLSLANYMAGAGLDRAAHKWFETKAPAATVEPSLITDHLIKPDASRIFDGRARLVWIGGGMERTREGILVRGNSEEREIKFPPGDADFLVKISEMCGDLTEKVTFAEVKNIYSGYGGEPFAVLYHSKKWDILRGYGLLQI